MNERASIAGQLTQALKQGRFVLYCQPIVPAMDTTVGYEYVEIFVRFLDEEEKLLPPGAFFPILETVGLTGILDRWVVSRVTDWILARQKAQTRWQLRRYSMNLAPESVRDPHFVRFVQEQLVVKDVAAGRLAFEIASECALMYREEFGKLARALKSIGCALTISDYRGGEPTVNWYQAAGVDTVKLARAMVKDVDLNATAIMRTHELNSHCQSAGLVTIAEMIERPETWQKVREIGVNYVQGFGIAQPLPLSDVS